MNAAMLSMIKEVASKTSHAASSAALPVPAANEAASSMVEVGAVTATMVLRVAVART